MGNLLASIGRMGSMLGETVDLDPLIDRIWSITWPILTVLAALGGLLAIWLGIRLATAQDESKRKEAKAQLIWAILAVVIIVVMIAIFGVVREVLPDSGTSIDV